MTTTDGMFLFSPGLPDAGFVGRWTPQGTAPAVVGRKAAGRGDTTCSSAWR